MAPPAEISIPTTSTSSADASKPYTLYNITLRLPLRSFVVQKRYSDFATLNQTLAHLVGAGPPSPLPGKSWFKSTLSSPELTENRRIGLEKYLRAIAESPDRRWRDTPAWRAFLNLPASSSTNNSLATADGRAPAINLSAANAAAAADSTTWTDMHREMKQQLHEARLQLARREAAAEGGKQSSAAVEAGAAAKRALVRAGNLLVALDGGLRTMADNRTILDGEVRRRRDLLSAARAERDGLEKLSASLASARGGSAGAGSSREGTPSSGDKAALLAGASSSGARAGGRVLGAPLPETERTRELENVGVLQLQRQQMQEQDQDVESLTKVIQRQKEMGLAIKDEVDRQTEMLDRMNDDVDRVGAKVKVAKDRVRKLGR